MTLSIARFFIKKALSTATAVPRKLGQLKMTQLEPAKWSHIITPEILKLRKLFDKNGFEIRVAGGAVRDLLQGKVPHDIDFATTATPDQMKAIFDAEQVRMINVQGAEKHGTITCRIDDKVNFEVTTLRIDIVTDGRHAEVQFTNDWQLDAGRRDLTINALFLDLDGKLYDYFGGRDDLVASRVRFVGNAENRIQEDYLRIFRYFRFFGRISSTPDQHEGQTLDAIRKNLEGLTRISGERIWMELRKILVGRFGDQVLKVMLDIGLGPFMGMPFVAPRWPILQAVYQRAIAFSPDSCTILSSLLNSEDEVLQMNKRLKLSNEELATMLLILLHRDSTELNQPNPSASNYYQLIASQFYLTQRCNKHQATRRVCELAKYLGHGSLIENGLKDWTIPAFPVDGADLIAQGLPRGKQFGMIVNDLKQEWIRSNFAMDRDELLLVAKSKVNSASADDKEKPDRSPLRRK